MPRYIVERTFPEGLPVAAGAPAPAAIVAVDADRGVTWVHSYVSADRTRTYCVYDAPSPQAIRDVAQARALPPGCITEVSMLQSRDLR
jgi:hypothetical protein